MTGSSTATSIKDEIFARMDQLSPAERKVARALLADYPSAGLTSAAAMAQAAGTSTPTVLRLVARLGMNGFAEFQARLRTEISHHLNAPVTRAQRRQRRDRGTLHKAISQRETLVDTLAATLPPTEFDRAVSALASKPARVLISGGYFSRHIAHILALQLDQLMPNVDYVAEPLGSGIGHYLAADSTSVVIIFDLRRYELASEQLARLAHQQGCVVIVITDQYISPATAHADIVLPVTVDGIPFDSFASLLVAVECLVAAVFDRIGKPALRRMRAWEERIRIGRALSDPTGSQ